MMDFYETKHVTVGNHLLTVRAFEAFVELSLGGTSWGQPKVTVMMPYASAAELADAIKSVIARRSE